MFLGRVAVVFKRCASRFPGQLEDIPADLICDMVEGLNTVAAGIQDQALLPTLHVLGQMMRPISNAVSSPPQVPRTSSADPTTMSVKELKELITSAGLDLTDYHPDMSELRARAVAALAILDETDAVPSLGEDTVSHKLGKNLIGKRVNILWPRDKRSYKGVICDFVTTPGKDKGKHVVVYDDGEKRMHVLSKYKYTIEPDLPSFRTTPVLPTLAELSGPTPRNLPVLTSSYTDTESYLDAQFRVNREDYVCSLRNALRCLQGDKDVDPRSVQIYKNVRLLNFTGERYGIVYSMEVEAISTGKIDWKAKKRLQNGALVALSADRFKTLIWAVVANSAEIPAHEKHVQVGIEFPWGRDPELQVGATYVMIESPEVFFEPYRRVLGVLKATRVQDDRSRGSDGQGRSLGFERHLEGKADDDEGKADDDEFSPPPFILPYLIAGVHMHEMPQVVPPGDIPRNADPLPGLNDGAFDTLDESQKQAMHMILHNELAVVQGPPGTGKTHVATMAARILLETGHVSLDNPLLVIAYTNHALDQFLEAISQFEDKIVRFGSRSDNAAMDKFKKHTVVKQLYGQYGRTSTRHREFEIRQEMDAIREDMDRFNMLLHQRALLPRVALDQVADGNEVDGIFSIENQDSQGFQTVLPKGGPVEVWLNGLTLENMGRIWSMPRTDRVAKYESWKNELRTLAQRSLDSTGAQYNALGAELRLLMQTKDAEILIGNVAVVGMTTSCSARCRPFLEKLGPRVVLAEEAAEVVEAHVFASIPSSTKQLILIGDHQQLRPSVQTYKMAKDHNLEISMFERLVNNGHRHVTLNVQRRMRPEISRIVRPIYAQLDDHPSVCGPGRQRSEGVGKDVFFISHEVPEDRPKGDSASKSNSHEATFLARFAKYIVQQGQYGESNITVLTFYLAQQRVLQDELQKLKLSDIRVSTVDRYQGEENEVILLSLVRSNAESAIGHCGVEQRVCVSLSRSRSALYVIGNDKILRQPYTAAGRPRNTPWPKLLDLFVDQDSLGTRLALNCAKHEGRTETVAAASDFDLVVPFGGCSRVCGEFRKCGHRCPLKCHTFDHDADEVKCRAPCTRSLDCSHPCPLLCHQDCFHADCIVCAEMEEIERRAKLEMDRTKMDDFRQSILEEIREMPGRERSSAFETVVLSERDDYSEYSDVFNKLNMSLPPKQDAMIELIEVTRWTPSGKDRMRWRQSRARLCDPVGPAIPLYFPAQVKVKGTGGHLGVRFDVPDAEQNIDHVGTCFPFLRCAAGLTPRPGVDYFIWMCDVWVGANRRFVRRSIAVDADGETKDASDLELCSPERRAAELYDSVQDGGTQYIFDIERVLPRYLVKFKVVTASAKLRFVMPRLRGQEFEMRVLKAPIDRSIVDQSPEQAEFQWYESQFHRMAGVSAPREVTKVTVIGNLALTRRYEKTKEELKTHKKPTVEHFVFHGTSSDDNLHKIAKDGFKIGGQDPGVAVVNGAAYGNGVYTALTPDTPVGYSGGTLSVILAKALPGKRSAAQKSETTRHKFSDQAGDYYTPNHQSDWRIFFSKDQLLPVAIISFLRGN
jgi:hypothetical protein